MSKRFVVVCVAMLGVLASPEDATSSITEIQNGDGYLVITDETGPVTDISLGSTVMVLDATNVLHAAGGIDTSLGFLRIPAANSCTMSQGYLCLDINGPSSALTSPVLQSRSSSTDRFFPSLVSGDLGTAGSKRLIGIGTGNTTETTVVTATPTANSVPLADGSGKIADGWLPSGVLRLSGLDTEAEARASGIKFVPMSDTPAASGEVPIKGATAWEWHAPITDLSGLDGRVDPNSYPVTPVLAYQNGDPNGSHPCNAGLGDLNETTPSEVGRKLVYDKTGKQLWVCTGAGNPSTATWRRLVPSDSAGLFMRTACMPLIAPTASSDNVPIWIAERATTLRKFGCVCAGSNCGTPATAQLKDDANDPIGSAATCGTTSTTWVDVSADADAALPANESARFDVTNTPTASGNYSFCLAYTVDGF